MDQKKFETMVKRIVEKMQAAKIAPVKPVDYAQLSRQLLRELGIKKEPSMFEYFFGGKK